jgi:hypothetical protein
MIESEMKETKMRILRTIGLSLAALAAVPPAFGQGCALCYTAADATGARGERMLDIGILVLLLPCLLLFAGVFVMLVRRARAATA